MTRVIGLMLVVLFLAVACAPATREKRCSKAGGVWRGNGVCEMQAE